jgi:endonuclease/exonuclease/phosphatase family metal-dependent hydrolase
MRFLFPASILLAALCGTAAAADSPPPRSLKLATWNLEWFMRPETLRELTPTCFKRDDPLPAGGVRAIPCDVAHERERSREDIAAMARLARRLDADIIALQEVDGVGAAKLLLPGYEFCFSQRTSVQNTGFALRRHIKFRCGPDLEALSLDDTVRRGVELTIHPGTSAEMHLLAVHLKSGCSRDALDSPRANCTQLARQVPILASWIASQISAGHPFAILGDFNRDLLRETGPARDAEGRVISLWQSLATGNKADFRLINTASGAEFRNCMPAQTFSGFIDYILLGNGAETWLEAGSFGRELFPSADAERRKLSDHCPASVRLNIPVAPKARTH